MIYINNPNLPQNSSIVLVGEEYCSQLSKELANYSVEVISVPKNPFVDPRISSHADISVLHLKENQILLSPHILGTKLEQELIYMGFQIAFSTASFNKRYPFDCPLNVYLSEDFAVLNMDTADKTIEKTIFDKYKKIVSCKQGYTKCMICPVNSNSIITSDPSIASKCAEQGIDVLKINQGYVDLPGYDYGFLGGSCFKLSSNIIAFTGTLDSHPDKNKILDFINKRGIDAVYLTDKNVFDIGSIIPIAEKPR